MINSMKGKDIIMWKHLITSSIAFFALAMAANAQSHRTIEAHAHLGNGTTTISATNWHNINRPSVAVTVSHNPYREYRGHDRIRHPEPRRYHQAPAGYYTTRTERVWVPGYWDVSYSRCGDRIRIWIPGGWEMRSVKVWIPYNTRGRR
jgi:hypothetical protein